MQSKAAAQRLSRSEGGSSACLIRHLQRMEVLVQDSLCAELGTARGGQSHAARRLNKKKQRALNGFCEDGVGTLSGVRREPPFAGSFRLTGAFSRAPASVLW